MIESREISVIVQGAINEFTKSSLLSIRSSFPEAQIILSTWIGEDIKCLEYDDVIFSEDPGALVIDDVSGSINNINRQIISTKAGLELANRKYCLKTRTDIIWKSGEFIKYFGIYDDKYESLHFSNRLLICNYYTRNPRVLPLPFHTSDWIVFGLLDDVNLFYDIECQSEEEIRWFENNKRHNHEFYTNLLAKYVPEQYICLGFVKKFYNVNCGCFYDASKENIDLTEEILAKDFVVLDYGKQLDIVFPKYNPNRYLEKFTLISHRKWKVLYKEYCIENLYLSSCSRKARSKALLFLFMFRKIILGILHKLHLKEKIKIILTKIKE